MMVEARDEGFYRKKLDVELQCAETVIAFGFTFATIDAESAEITAYLTALKPKDLQKY